MDDLLGYRGRRVVVSGCTSGMGRATADLLAELGAEVHGLDYRPSEGRLASFQQVDLRDPDAIARAASALPERIDALFNCAGLGPTFPPLDIVKVNFVGLRALSERLLPRVGAGGAVASVASTAAFGWNRRIELHKALIATRGYEEAVGWAEAHPDEVGEGYSFSKEAVVVWTLMRSQAEIVRGVRVNCILPGLTDTPMLSDQIAVNTKAEVLEGVIQPIGRPAQPQEQAFFLAVLNSGRASYLNGAALNVDGGRFARLSVGAA